MTVKLASLKADLNREEKGDWVEFIDWPGVEFNVSSLHVPAFTLARDLMYQKLARIHKKKPAPRETISVELGKLFAKHILHGWRGLDVDYTPEKAEELLGNPEWRNLVAAIEWCAGKLSDVEAEFIEGTEKN